MYPITYGLLGFGCGELFSRLRVDVIQRLMLLVRSPDGADGFTEGFEPLDRGKALCKDTSGSQLLV
jgi:hypothetical protein